MTEIPDHRGQATVELALVLPLVVILLALLVQAGLAMRDQILVTHAAREAARAAALDSDRAAALRAARAAGPLDPDHLEVKVSGRGPRGSRVTAHVVYRRSVAVPFLAGLLPNLQLRASATMRVER